uniref:separase n=1 Tax=Fagus sylvatica TaxID=28930 RepID=A0A2N9IGR6_FAGSY
MASATESSLLSKLESSDSTGDIYPMFSDYLHPFSDLTNPNQPQQIRPLAKKFLPFLNRTLSLLPKRLSSSDPHSLNDRFTLELLRIYRLCLDCLDSLSSQLSCKPYSVHVQRVRMLHCMEAMGKYSDAEAEGFRVLESFRGTDFGVKVKKSAKSAGKFLPIVEKCGSDKEFALLVVEVVATLVKCAAMGQSKDGEVYRRAIGLVEEVRPWFRVLDANTYEKLHRALVSYLGKCTFFLVGELACFDGDLVRSFCYATITDYAKSSLKDQIYKVARRICSSLFSLQENRPSLIIDILMCVLDSVARECKFEVEITGIEYVELVSYCANKCRTASANLSITMATHLNKIAGDSHQVRPPFDMILRLYAAGLHLINSDVKSRGGDLTSSGGANYESAIRILCDDGDIVQNLAALLGSLGSYFHIGCKENCVTSNVKHTDSVGQSFSQSSGYEASISCTQNNIKAHLLSYLNALKFLCQPLADLVNSERKQLISENGDSFVTTKLCIIQDAFYQFTDIFLSCQSCTYERERDGFDENSKAVLSVAIAAFTLSIRTKLKMKASKALKLCCRASWTCVKRLCVIFVQKPKGLDVDLSEDAIIEFVNEACTRSAFLLDVLHQCDSHKVKRTIAEILEDWSVPGKVFEMLPGPVPLVKQWVKMECKRCTSVAEGDSIPTLYCLLSSSVQLSKRTIGIILEQHEVYGETCSRGIPTCHQLAVTYCLRALCTQEAEPNSKRIVQDINAALKLWLSICIPDHCSADDLGSMVSENTVLLLYNIIDLLSMKGCMDFHLDIYRLMTRLFKFKNVPLENCLAKLWESRRTTHALCISPINEAFIINLSEHYGDLCKSVDFWISCLKGSQPLKVGFQQSFSFSFASSQASCNQMSTFRSDITVNEVKEAAFQLISCVPIPSQSVFLAGNLYYDLCERLLSNGRLIEALSYAKEAHRLRTRLFQEKFMYSVEQHTEKYNETGDIVQKLTYGLKNLQNRSIATEIWSFDTIQWDLEGCYLSPWNVLQCYLESTLQIGIIHEIIGNGAEAETFLIWGKDISCLQSLPLFIVAFSSVLGKLYRKKRLWDLAEKELQSAKKILMDTSTTFSCMKCRLMMEATLDQHLGDLVRSNSDSTAADISVERLSHAENLYKLALDKLNLSVWKNCVSCPEKANAETNNQGRGKSTREAPKAKMEAKKSRKNAPKPLPKDQCLIPENNSRLTRSKYRSTQNLSMSTSGELQVGGLRCLKGNNASDFSDTISQRESLLETDGCIVSSGSEVKCICNKMGCWHCLLMEVMNSGLVDNLLNMKWELVRRRLSLRLLTSIGKCFGNRGQIHETHKVLFQSVSVLVSRNLFGHIDSSVPPTFLLDFIGKEISGDAFTVERAAILFNISWFYLKSYHSKDTRTSCCDLFDIHLPKLVSWLKLAFVLCREVPILFQKVSKLLATIYVLSASTELFPLSSSCEALFENHWASYFHQASLGTHLNYQLFSNMVGRCKVQHVVDAEGSHITGCGREETSNLIRLAPDSIQDLEEFVTKFFVGLPCMTVICISLLGGAYANLVKDLLHYPTCVHAWMLVSRLNSKRQPVVLLLPVDPVIEEASDDDANSGCDKLYKSLDMGEHWHCPWGSTVVDDVAPVFKLILEENYLSSSMFPLEDTKRNRTLWWMWRKKLDCRLGKLLRNIEDSWLGHWKYVLLGEWSNRKHLDLTYKKLVHDLKSKCKLDVNESLLKVILGGSKYAFEGEACISRLCLRSGCYVGRAGYCNEAKCGTSSNASVGVDKQSELAFQLIQEAVNELEGEDSVNREPIILVLDSEMLPWENLPVLRNQEVYRMPSVGSISSTLDRSHHQQEQVGRNCATFPLIDPLDAFYLLNPSGDLSNTQVEFENWFRDHNLEGKAGSAPTAEELVAALKSHDLFIYFGHGSGAQYIPRHEIQKLENCAATFLMGCSSGSLTLNGSYIPQGTPLSYLLAGSPVIVANLWEVTDKDIDRFGKAMLDAWLRERSSPSLGCAECDLVVEEFEAMTIRGRKGNTRRKTRRKKSLEAHETSSFKGFCDHGPKIGSFMSQAREACTLPFLIGASPVCYGIPTGIRRKTDLNILSQQV